MGLLCLLAASLLLTTAEGVTWEFGQDRRQLSVISQASGRIKPLGKLTRITLPVPECMEIKYVRVDVYNEISTPAVSYNQAISTVTIAYKLLQSSWSTYEVMAKGARSLQCGGGEGRGREWGGGGWGGEGRGRWNLL